MILEDPDKAWQRIEDELKNNSSKKKFPEKKVWTNPLQEKYQELIETWTTEYPKAEPYNLDYNRLMDKIRAFELVFLTMGWDKRP